jgi:protein gp37
MVFDAVGQRYGVPGAWQARSSARVDWIVVGGESGPGARPMDPNWARDLRDQCVAADVPFFFKQFGEWAPNGWHGIGNINPRERLVGPVLDDMGHREVIERVGKKAAGRVLDGRTWDEYPRAAQPAAA